MKEDTMVASPPKRGTLAYLEAFPNEVLTMTLDEYWELEPQNQYKSTFFQNKVTAIMPYTSENHNRLSRRLVYALGAAVEENGAELFYETRPVWIASAELNTYPDIFIVEKSNEVKRRGKMTAETTPSVIIEILSDSTEQDDRGKKMRAYKQLPTVEQIVLVSQNEPLVEVYERGESVGKWVVSEFYGMDKTVEIAGITVSLATLYAGVNFNGSEETV